MNNFIFLPSLFCVEIKKQKSYLLLKMVRFYKKVMHFLTLVKEVNNRNFSVTFFCITYIRFFIYYIFSSFISFFLSCVLSFSLYFLFSSVFLFILILCYILPFLLLWFLSIFLFFFPFRCWMKYKNMGKCFEDTYTQTREPLTMTTFALSSFSTWRMIVVLVPHGIHCTVCLFWHHPST